MRVGVRARARVTVTVRPGVRVGVEAGVRGKPYPQPLARCAAVASSLGHAVPSRLTPNP